MQPRTTGTRPAESNGGPRRGLALVCALAALFAIHGVYGSLIKSATFEIEGQQFIAFDGGPAHSFTPAFSIYVNCESQAEVDELWGMLTEGGAESQCGWLQDRFGLSWQIIPSVLPRLLGDPDRAKAGRALNAMLQMKKIDIATLERAAAGE